MRAEYDIETSYLRLRAYPFTDELNDFIRRHERVYVVEQNRDAQLLALMRLEVDAGGDRQTAQRALLTAGCRSTRAPSPTNVVRQEGKQMSTAATPPPKKVNRIGLEVVNYKGTKTTLCAGCGHNAISERIVECFYELGVQPWSVAKFSGIGCSSKSPAYFLGLSHGFNGVHGRMPSLATGAMLANQHAAGHRRHRRRRHRLHRPRPVHAPGPPQSAVDLHHRK